MNIDFIPILGEYNLENKCFVLNLVSFNDIKLNINLIAYNDDFNIIKEKETYKMNLDKYYSKKIILKNIKYKNYKIIFDDATNEKYTNNTNEIKIIIPENISSKINIFNCDCHFVPETGIWESIDYKETSISFHLGDQIYLDLLFMDLCKKLQDGCCIRGTDMTFMDLRKKVYNVYKESFLRKKNILQGSFNIMLGDDHDICDESLRTKYDSKVVDRVVKIFKDIYEEIQKNCKIDDSKIVNYDNKSFLLIDNIRCLTTEKYAENIENIINETKNNIKKNLYILTPRIPINYSLDKITKLVYEAHDNNYDYLNLYNNIFNLDCQSFNILCGDEHHIKKIEITQKNTNKKCDLYFVGPINSVLDEYKSNNFLTSSEFNVNEIYTHKKHGYITIKNDVVEHQIFKCYINKIFGSFVYISKYLYYR